MKILESKVACIDCKYQSILFQKLQADELNYINTFKRTYAFSKGEMIVQEGMEVNEIMYLKFGLVKLFIRGNSNRDQIIRIARPLDYVSLLSVFTNSTYKYSISAIEDSIICAFKAENFKELVNRNANFGLSILEKISNASDEIIKTTYQIKKKHLRGRIAYILIYFSTTIYNQDSFELPISRREIAELIEMTTENVIRILSEFRKDRLISIDGKRIGILNMEMLKMISELG
jgi:CRP/FNR family transcriptional regulator